MSFRMLGGIDFHGGGQSYIVFPCGWPMESRDLVSLTGCLTRGMRPSCLLASS